MWGVLSFRQKLQLTWLLVCETLNLHATEELIEALLKVRVWGLKKVRVVLSVEGAVGSA